MIDRAPPVPVMLGVAAMVAAAVLTAGAWLLAPGNGERLGAALSAGDRTLLARVSMQAERGGAAADPGTAMLLARSQLAAGKADAALSTLTPVAAARPGDPAVVALIERALVAAGRQEERLHLLQQEAARRPSPEVFRRWRALALAAGNPGDERSALAGLARVGAAGGEEVERLAFLDEQAGDGNGARKRLAARRAAGAPLSTDALQRLLRLSLAEADGATLAELVAALAARGAPPTRLAIVDDLVARHRPDVALALIDAAPTSEAPGLWRRRVDSTRATGDTRGAQALLAAAAARPGIAPAADIIAVAYALNAEPLILVAAEHGAVPRPDRALALDLARRWSAQPALIARLDRVAGPDWRRDDPWLAMRLAMARKDRTAALAAAAMLPPAQRGMAREDLLARLGDTAGLRAELIDRAGREPAARPALAERLLAMGARDDATRLLQTIVATPDDQAARRLLYLWGPRPGAAALAWLRQRAADAPDAETRARWLSLYARRDRPQAALTVLERDTAGTRTPLLLTRLELAAAAGDAGASTRALAALLDGRDLSAAQLAQATGAMLPATDARLRASLAKRRIAAGQALAGDRMDIAWTAWNAHDLPAARAAVAAQLAAQPDDAAALMLMAEIEDRGGSPAHARRWRTSALAAVRRRRAQAPADRALMADEGRLLVALGQAGAARALLSR